MKGLYNDPERMAELYGYWQTIPWKNELTEDGKIPKVTNYINNLIYRTNMEILN